ncbi:hypothetical protein PpBr36_04903 [Pyricularia pennisetigena]|uniref:hypothetical protein n=1 Tax=Pyricularia pennisetigena TaxID=1578925 RepID=UPI00114F80F4|nr:hypothetical protein PpBr36_04903 [Pyricularia pennisetigena]TLS27200.1 hypothetical protein PpBr36_04903 [Pyricularia pennisetigena]
METRRFAAYIISVSKFGILLLEVVGVFFGVEIAPLRHLNCGGLHHHVAAIGVQYLVVVKHPSLAGKEQDGRGHVLIVARSACRVRARLQPVLVLLVRLARRHLARENARRDLVDPDLGLDQQRRQHARQVHGGGLGSRVRRLAHGAALHQPADGGHVDDLGRVARRLGPGLAEKRDEGRRHEVVRRHVGPERLVPRRRVRREGVGRCVVGLAGAAELGLVVSRDAGIVDQEVDALGLLFAHLAGQADALVLGGDVARQSNDLARAGGVFLDHIVQRFLASAGDVDLGAVGLQGLCDHQADAGAAAGHDGCDVRDVKEDIALEVFVAVERCHFAGLRCECFRAVVYKCVADARS